MGSDQNAKNQTDGRPGGSSQDFTPLVKQILKAPIYDLVKETPLDAAPLLSKRLGVRVHLKREDLQPVFSFKLRGAYNRLLNLSEQARARGVIAASAGNHAQGLAMAATHLGCDAYILMPVTTPTIKVEAVRRLGGQVTLYGDTFDEAYLEARRIESEKGYTFVHPFDHEHVIAGQGTIAMEVLRQCHQPLDAIFICVGGGGLVAGMSVYLKYLSPQTRVIGVEPEDAASMAKSLAAGERVILPEVGLFADGAAVRQVGEVTFQIARHCVDEIITVSTDEICAAIKDIYEETRSISEPAGALAVAGMKKYRAEYHARGMADPANQTWVAINSGSNMNFSRLRNVSERTDLGEGKEVLLAVTIPETPGSFRDFCASLGARDISEFNYRYSDSREAKVYVGIQVADRDSELALIMSELTAASYPVVDMTDNELAKIHLRHLVGGRTHHDAVEVFYRFAFPERPGALLAFLNEMGNHWNISLFHYRNHGAAYGRVLVGFQIVSASTSAQLDRLHEHFRQLGYPFFEETQNPAIKAFLS